MIRTRCFTRTFVGKLAAAVLAPAVLASFAITGCSEPPPPKPAPPPPPPAEPAPEPAPREPVSPDHDLSFMRGCWRGEEDGAVTVERWGPNRNDGLVGESRTTRGDELINREYLMIKRTADGITLTAFPKGQPHTVFEAVEGGDQRIVFENLEHDYPQRIAYWANTDGTLSARIEGNVDGKAKSSEWTWSPASGAACKIGK